MLRNDFVLDNDFALGKIKQRAPKYIGGSFFVTCGNVSYMVKMDIEIYTLK